MEFGSMIFGKIETTKNPRLILVNGKKRSGKDWFAEKLQEELYKNKKTSEVMSFAEPIKNIIAQTLNISEQELDDYKNEKRPLGINYAKMDGYSFEKLTDFRAILQNFGTEAMKKWFGDDVWLNLFRKRFKTSNVDYIIVPDFRFRVEHIKNSITVKIKNDEVDSTCTDTHASENELNCFKFDFIIDNSGQPDLTDQVQRFVKFLEQE